jgi:hypothetical protein
MPLIPHRSNTCRSRRLKNCSRRSPPRARPSRIICVNFAVMTDAELYRLTRRRLAERPDRPRYLATLA